MDRFPLKEPDYQSPANIELFFNTHAPGCSKEIQWIPAAIDYLIEIRQEQGISPEFMYCLDPERKVWENEETE